MTKHAYLIMAYNNPNQLTKLLKLIDDPRNDIFLHIDSKSSLSPDSFSKCVDSSNIYCVTQIPVYWADYSQVEAEYILLKAALNSDASYSYYHLLSGMDLPIKTQDEIHAYFDNTDKEYLGIVPIESDYTRSHIKYDYSFLKSPKYRASLMWKVFGKISIKCQQLFRVDKTYNPNNYHHIFLIHIKFVYPICQNSVPYCNEKKCTQKPCCPCCTCVSRPKECFNNFFY